ncbi:MAG: hypothetical protein OEM52_07335 [bacterium]|nr:hypothetical protein [bacterium]
MRYLVISMAELQDVEDLERGLELRLKAAEAIKKLYKPDALYFLADKIGLCFIVNLESVQKLSEVLVLLSRAGLHAESIPLLDINEMQKLMADMANPDLIL